MSEKLSAAAEAPPYGSDLVDLSLPISEDLPCHWAHHLPFQHKTWNWFETRHDASGCVYSRNGPYATRWMAIDEHTGTHIDAPSHFIPPADSGLPHAGEAGAVSVDRIPLERHMGPAAVVDVTDLVGTVSTAGESPVIDAGMLRSWEHRHGRFREGEVCLFRTGWDSRYLRGAHGSGYVHDVLVTREVPAWPAPEVDAVELLLERGVRCLGIDAPSMGPAHGDRGQAVHVAGLGAGAVYVECLTGLDQLPTRGASFLFLPLKVERATGCPGRAVAWVPSS